jgi:hypothetical protein
MTLFGFINAEMWILCFKEELRLIDERTINH